MAQKRKGRVRVKRTARLRAKLKRKFVKRVARTKGFKRPALRD